MPLGPMKALEFAHNAIVATTAEIEAAVLAAAGPEVAVALQGKVGFLAEFVHGHVTGEEAALYPPLAARVPHIDKTFLVDHRDEEQIYRDLEGEVVRCAEAASGERFRHLVRAVSILRALSDSHVRKENEIVLPLVGDLFSIDEQAAMLQGILAVFPPAKMPTYVPWIVGCQGPDAAVAYVTALQRAMPAPAFEAARGWIQGGVSAERWALLTARVAGLA